MEWDKCSISVLPSNGKGGILKSKIIFGGLGIPNYIVFDKDRGNNRENKRLLKLVNYPDDELPDEKIHDKWSYNNYNLEDELKNMLGEDVYEEIWEQIEGELDCDDTRIRKNPEMTSRFTEIVYERGLSLPHYENIVKRIDRLFNLMR